MASIRNIDFSPELQFRTSRSSGKGGQNVNKVESRVELLFQPASSSLLTEHQKALIAEKLANRISHEGILLVTSEEDRSQLKNKQRAVEKLYDLLDFALKEHKKRRKTRPTRSSVAKRLDNKKQHSQKKAMRRGEF